MDTSSTHINDHLLSLPGTCTQVKEDGIKLVLWAQAFP